MRKQLEGLGRSNVGYQITYRFKPKLMLQVEKQDRVIDASFRLYGELQAEHYSMAFLWNPCNVLMRMHKKKQKKEHFLYIGRRVVVIATGANLLDTKYKIYGYNDDLRGTIN